ncbi:MAG: hypothetical protein ACM31C_34335 [Acidobacteriota bacterium]
MLRILACSIFTITALAGCGGGTCLLPGDDGSCGGGGGGGGSAPSFHSFGDPQLMKLAGADLLNITSADDADDYTGYAGDSREEATLSADGSPPVWAATPIAMFYTPSFSCADVCVAAWHTRDDPVVHAAIRTPDGWLAPTAFESAIRSPAAATFGDVVLVAWATWVSDAGARVELRRLDAAGHLTGSWTLATAADHGHLSVTMTATGGLVTWQRGSVKPDGTLEAFVVAQLLDTSGAPAGTPFELAGVEGDADYYRGAPTVFAGGVYHVVHGGLGAGVPWFVVDPVARTIALDPLPALADPIEQIVPLADGLALSVGDLHGGVAKLAAGQLSPVLAYPDRVTIAPAADGSLAAAFGDNGSVYLTSIPATVDAEADAVPIVKRYEVSSGGGCAAGGGGGGLALVAMFMGIRLSCARRGRRPPSR